MFARIFTILAFTLAFCFAASSCSATEQDDIIGTWRWVGVDRRPVNQSFYVRYYPDGTCASWPAPKGWSDAKGVSRGRYSVADGALILDTGSGKLDPKAKLSIKGDRMTMTNEESNRLVYRRVMPTLEPGKLEPGKP